jgi:prepilin-type N-terminal cleavage/methylation domain-containing protein
MDNQAASTEQRGFTLLEIMIVLALIGLLMSAVGVAVWKKFRDGQIKAAQLQVRDVAGEVGHFMVMKGKCPTVQDLVDEHLIRNEPHDPWGTAITIKCPGEHEHDPADVVSCGPDKRPDTADDIRSWEL